MKFTSKDLMKSMGLQVGDKIKYHNEVFTIVEMPNAIGFENDMGCYNIDVLLNKDFEILPSSKRVGETKGDDYEDCINCPLRLLSYCGHHCDGNLSMYTALEQTIEYVKHKGFFDQEFDQEIYDLLKAKLDKEVVEE